MATETVQLPSESELDEALEKLREAPNILAVTHRVTAVSQFRGDAAPTLEDIGRLYSWALDARARLEEALDYVKSVEEALQRLLEVRDMNNVDPDAGTCSMCGRTDVRAALGPDGWRYLRDLDDNFTLFCPECWSTRGEQS